MPGITRLAHSTDQTNEGKKQHYLLLVYIHKRKDSSIKVEKSTQCELLCVYLLMCLRRPTVDRRKAVSSGRLDTLSHFSNSGSCTANRGEDVGYTQGCK